MRDAAALATLPAKGNREDRQERIGRRGSAGEDRQERIGRRGSAGEDRQEMWSVDCVRAAPRRSG